MADIEHSRVYSDFLKILRRSTDRLNEDPIREEIFSVERLELYASYLSREFKINDGNAWGRSFFPELRDYRRKLLRTYLSISEAIRNKETVTPAAEWFVDNHHIIEDQLREIRIDLPKDYYRELPKLTEGELKGYPRVYAMAMALIAHTDSRLDAESLKRFIRGFQRSAPLRIGELWAVPITLRVALLEHLTPLAMRIVSARENRKKADALADRMLALAAKPGSQSVELVALLSAEMGQPENFDRAFVVQLTQRLRDQDPDVWPAFDWLEEQLKKHGTDTASVIQLDHKQQAAAQVTVGNIISSMRLISNLDWHDFFENVSVVDPILELDPANVYLRMDFATRDQYRHAVERIAKRSRGGELEVAHMAVKLASRSARENPADHRRAHVGYYLIGKGVVQVEEAFNYKPWLHDRIFRKLVEHPTALYLGSITLLTTILLLPVLKYFDDNGGSGLGIFLLTLLILIPASEFALSILNHYIPFFVKPKPLPKMDMALGIPKDAQTMVVIPTLFTSVPTVQDLLSSLQIHFLANQDPAISFALLGDFGDANAETAPADEKILQAALDGIEELNQEHCADGPKRFFLFHRRRLWNESEGKWIGWERKRGKILEFNRLLRGAKDTSYTVATAPLELLLKIKYVITLDSDTQLPRDSAHRLIGTILHPLNHPHYDEKIGRVTEGYGILQPRISVALPSSTKTRFAKLYSGNVGLDPYTTAVSDIYQDLFGEGSFTGKGLYVVDAFEQALASRVPENTVLSHDLFEGSYARSALVTDVELFDDYPSTHEAFSKRQHRWTRGDWQIGAWLFPKVPAEGGKKASNTLSMISRWKIFDNLRRSLLQPAMFLWLIMGWTILPGSPWLWTSLVVLMVLVPAFLSASSSLLLHRRTMRWKGHLGQIREQLAIQFMHFALLGAFLAQQSWNQVDAIVRVYYRKWISKKKLLEWVTFAQVEQSKKSKAAHLEFLAPGPITAVVLSIAISVLHPSALPVAAPFLIAWFANPLIQRWLSVRTQIATKALGSTEIQTFRLYARRTWHFFETFVTAESNWLAPDNFQEDPVPVVAHRTSPTNIGLQLLSAASAYDFGYIGLLSFVESVERTFATMAKMEMLRGHFLNWYDTKTLEPLKPAYISTVDSGNLAGHLLTLKQICQEMILNPHTPKEARAGLIDTILILREETGKLAEVSVSSTGSVTLRQMEDAIAEALVILRGPKAETSAEWSEQLDLLSQHLSVAADVLKTFAVEDTPEKFVQAQLWMELSLNQVKDLQRDLKEIDPAQLIPRLKFLRDCSEEWALGMDFRFLLDQQRKMFVIGYDVANGRHDNSFYDLLASESRLASFVAIAKGDVPQEHWFRLGRKMTPVKGGRALIAWTATMFEYLMPLLVMRRFPGTLLDQTYEAVVARQIEYGKQRSVPWGISEAGFNARDLHLNYQYGPFGIPGLGLKRGLSDDLVISPYSTMLASMVDPWSALANLEQFQKMGVLARYGFYEAIDYTTERLPKKQRYAVLRSFMAHHQGMSLVSMNNLLHRQIMQRRFHDEPLVQSTELLLHERMKQDSPLTRPRAEEVSASTKGNLQFLGHQAPKLFIDVNLPTPRTQILSNGSYSVMLTSAGAGYSQCGGVSLSRWREDVTRDHWGHFCYVRNRRAGRIWSTGHQPVGLKPRKYEVTFSEEKVDIWRQDGKTNTHTEIIVSPEDNVELRRVSLTNHSGEMTEFEVTSFMELALARAVDDAAHPAFSNLFVQTEFVPDESVLLATRRPRSKEDKQPWAFHVAVTEGETTGTPQYETDRARFLGRGRNAMSPAAIGEDRPLSNTVGAVLDPAFSMRQIVRVKPGETARITFATGLTNSREEALRLADKYHDIHIFAREAELAWTKSQVQLRHLNINSDKAHIYQRLASRVLYSDPSLRPRPVSLAKNTKTQSSLWAYGISGDLPIVLSRISDEKDMAMLREVLRAHEYLRLKGLAIDLVILNERATGYMQALQDELQRQIRMSGSQGWLDKPGGIFIRRTDTMPAEDLTLLRTVARVDLSAASGTLDEQLTRRPIANEKPKRFLPSPATAIFRDEKELPFQHPPLDFFNGLGGFTKDGREYVIVLRKGQWTPAPWINVIANEKDFGCLVSESGSGYTWSVNSRENRLTPWSNDPVSDTPGEAIYIRDEDTGQFWTPTPLPIRDDQAYVVTHGQGYSRFEHNSHGISQELSVFVPTDATVKVQILRLKNRGEGARRISVTSFAEWVLGVQRGASGPYVMTDVDQETGAIFARNPYNNEFAGRVAFAQISEERRELTCDRKEFLGRNGGFANPEAMSAQELSGATGAGLDPCASFRTSFELQAGEEREIVILLGQGRDEAEARELARNFRDPRVARAAMQSSSRNWDRTLGAIQVSTPDAAMDVLMNRWLVYQNLSCRIWARSAFYQSGGAYGFRDQLQDVMAMVYSQPDIAREQILRASGRQFPEGDVQHWWHPPTGRGVRTRFSDDLIWLPFVVSFYINATGDESILQERVSFLEAPSLNPGQDDSYTMPAVSNDQVTVLEHCARALDRSLKVGRHGLPLMGSGDWNDGMSRVGNKGEGESVWVGWFLHQALRQFLPHCEKAGDAKRTEAYRKHMPNLQAAIEANAWDGNWYRRAYFDDGTPLGSASNEECRIDSIAQSWAVLSGAGNPQRAARAMAAVETYLVRREDGLIQLFAPPFDRSSLDPGYIKGYVPGVRENGGQYTHAAIWTVMAFAALGDGDKAGELFSLLNPINHASTRAGLHKYKVEPYVIAADIYGMFPHVGRGGWTWYTGSASWMYRAGLESILGFALRGDRFTLRPCLPNSWPGFEMTYRPAPGAVEYAVEVAATEYKIRVVKKNSSKASEQSYVELDGVRLDSMDVPVVRDGKSHTVVVTL